MTWMAIKAFVKKAWVFIKEYWSIPLVLIAALTLFFIHRETSKRLLSILNSSTDSYREQIKVINSAHQAEIEKRDALLNQYGEVIELLEKKYEEDEQELNERKKREIRNIIEKYNGDTESLAKELGERYGIEYVSH